MGIAFDKKEVIPDTVARLEIVSAELTDTYGPQLSVKLKALGGDHDGFTFMDYSTRDEESGNIRQGTKAWSIFQAALGMDFHEQDDVDEQDLVGEKIMAKVTRTKTGSRNKLEFGTIGPYQPPKKKAKKAPDASREPEEVEEEEDDDDPLAKAPF